MINTVRASIEENVCITVAEVERYYLLSHGTVIKIIRVCLSMTKSCARWIPKSLDDEHKWNGVAEGLDFISHYHTERKDLFDQIVTGEEKWVHHFTPKMKSASTQLVAKGDDCPLKTEWERSAGKVYLMTFWDNQGTLLEEYTPKVSQWQRKLTSILFCTFGRQSRRNILVNRHGVWSCCMTMSDLTSLNLSHFFSRIFAGICSGTPHIRPISHPLITISLRIFISGREGNDFRRMPKLKRQSITTSKNWTKIFMLLAFQSNLTATVLLALETMQRSSCQCIGDSIKINFTLAGPFFDF